MKRPTSDRRARELLKELTRLSRRFRVLVRGVDFSYPEFVAATNIQSAVEIAWLLRKEERKAVRRG